MKDWKTYALALVLVLAGCSPTAPPTDAPPSSPAPARSPSALPASPEAAAPAAPTASPDSALAATPTPDPYAPHGDGDYIIGAHIAAGRWQSDGAAEGECYWTTRKANGIILKSYIGPSTGAALELGGYDYEVQFRNCGTWEYLGP